MSKDQNREYQERSRAARRAQGGKAVTVMLSPDEVKALLQVQQMLGLSIRDAIGIALLELAQAPR